MDRMRRILKKNVAAILNLRFSQRQKSPFWDRRRFLDYNIQRYIREQIMKIILNESSTKKKISKKKTYHETTSEKIEKKTKRLIKILETSKVTFWIRNDFEL